ncbi:DUF4870 domain-containing protein [Candidatus Micrarchaeota archaeon]|nr:DUF4870 domain-containing protein [Candidatus Micrarchaeota archaeon]
MAEPKSTQKEAAPSGSGSSENNLLGALAYIIAVLVPLFVIFTEKKNDKALLFHAYQSLILSIVSFVLVFGITFVSGFLALVTAGIGALVGCLTLPLMLGIGIVHLFAAYKAYQGEKYMLPVIGEIAQKQVK